MGIDAIGLVSAAVQAGTAGLNWYSQQQANQLNEKMQREQWAREDSAMQRRVADLKAAGLNPVLAAGGGGASSDLSMRFNAPQVEGVDFSKVLSASLFRQQQKSLDLENSIKINDVMSHRAVAQKEGVEASIAAKRYDFLNQRKTDTGKSALDSLFEQEYFGNLAKNQEAVLSSDIAESQLSLLHKENELKQKDIDNYDKKLWIGAGTDIISTLAGAIRGPMNNANALKVAEMIGKSRHGR